MLRERRCPPRWPRPASGRRADRRRRYAGSAPARLSPSARNTGSPPGGASLMICDCASDADSCARSSPVSRVVGRGPELPPAAGRGLRRDGDREQRRERKARGSIGSEFRTQEDGLLEELVVLLELRPGRPRRRASRSRLWRPRTGPLPCAVTVTGEEPCPIAGIHSITATSAAGIAVRAGRAARGLVPEAERRRVFLLGAEAPCPRSARRRARSLGNAERALSPAAGPHGPRQRWHWRSKTAAV